LAIHKKIYKDRKEWLQNRKFIGGSDAGVILGVCPWKTNEELWEEKVGIKEPDDISDNPLVMYGTFAEEHLRALFSMDYPQYHILHDDNAIITNDAFPFASASLDGELFDKDGEMGILEIKTATISSKAQKEKWAGNSIPQNYYAQILHYFLVTEAKFAYLKAQLKYEMDGEEPFLYTKHYRIERSEVEDDIKYLEEKEREFWSYIEKNERPHTVLPEI